MNTPHFDFISFGELFSNVLRLLAVISSTNMRMACWCLVVHGVVAFDEATPSKWPIQVEHYSHHDCAFCNRRTNENDYHSTPNGDDGDSQFHSYRCCCTHTHTIQLHDTTCYTHSKCKRNNNKTNILFRQKKMSWKIIKWKEHKTYTCNLSNENLRKRSYQIVNSNFLLLWKYLMREESAKR